jgi:hypothetical protein
MKKEKQQQQSQDLLTERKTVLFTPSELKAIAQKAMASHLKVSQAIRLLTLKSLGVIQTNLFG